MEGEYVLEEICRTCTSTSSKHDFLIPIFWDDNVKTRFCNENMKIYKEITYTLMVDVKPNDGLPQQICEKCFNQLTDIQKFRELSTKAQDTLIKYFKNPDNSKLKNVKFEMVEVNKISEEIEDGEMNELNIKIELNENEKNCEIVEDIEIDCANKDILANSEDEPLAKIQIRKKICKNKPIKNSNSDGLVKIKIRKNNYEIKPFKKLPRYKKCKTCNKYCFKSNIKNHVKICKFLLSMSQQKDIDKSMNCCSYCDQIFDSEELIYNHIKKNHLENYPYVCLKCDDEYDTYKKLRTHIKNNHDFLKVECKICNKIYNSNTDYTKHVKTHPDGEYECSLCSKTFTNSQRFDIHLKTHDDSLKIHKCKSCDKSFIALKRLQIHEKIHCEGVPIVCEKCGKSFKSRQAFKAHLVTHTFVKTSCDYCGRKFETEKLLTRHLLTVHKDEVKNDDLLKDKQYDKPNVYPKRFECTVCSIKFFIPSALEKHMKLHDASRKYPCTACLCAFNSSAHLRRHFNRFHVTEKNYICKFCPRSFSDPDSRLTHEKFHFGKPKNCRFCGKSVSEAHIKYHENQHTGEKPCLCLICNKSFRYPSALGRHYNKVHSVEDYKKLEEQLAQKVQNPMNKIEDPEEMKLNI